MSLAALAMRGRPSCTDTAWARVGAGDHHVGNMAHADGHVPKPVVARAWRRKGEKREAADN
jgi:hypothetical protein